VSLIKAGYRLRAAAALSCSCAASSFVCRVRVQHRGAAAACGCWSTLFLRHKTVSTERTQHTVIPLPRDKEPLRFGSTRGKFVRGNMVSTLRGRTTNIASRGSRARSIPRLKKHVMKTYGAMEAELHAFLNLSIKWRCVISFKSRPLYPRRKNHKYSTAEEDAWAPKPVSTPWKTYKSHVSDGNRTPYSTYPKWFAFSECNNSEHWSFDTHFFSLSIRA
jgi:hypothetical protein